jgi:hypothetical protein
MRQIIIYTNNLQNLQTIPETIKQQLETRNIKIQYNKITNNNEERIELYGYDKLLKYINKNISSKTKLNNALKIIITKIDKMPMGSIEKIMRTRKRLLVKCGLPDVAETKHCFADTTHHTCCMLGSKAREYADSSGNPIGSLSVKVQSGNKLNKIKKKLIPWCTCTGSKVCSHYKSKFGLEDGTYIKFIGNLSSRSKKNIKTNNLLDEDKAIAKLNILRHHTPGIMI